MIGNNPSIFQGEGLEFVELREYQYGDDVKKIDWYVSAKMQKPYVKIYREERELNIVIVSLLSGSVNFGSKKLKIDTIAETAAILAFSAIKNGDLFSSLIFTDSLKDFIKPTKQYFAVRRALERILSFNPLGQKIDSKNLVNYLFERIRRRSIIFLIGDFLDPIDLKLISRKHEIIALIVRDKLEEEPPDLGFISLIDPVKLIQGNTDLNSKTSKSVKKEIYRNDHALYSHFRKNRIRFTKIYTHEEPFVKLSKLFIGK
ncbi:MAG: DUF58 domain-containing protein [Epsilonproteobacteria bacterium]|nr:DUF58 domain-containing protein [Campylobacterota bacterium]